MTSYESHLAVALELADAVSHYTLDAFRGRTMLAVRSKPDDTPVTEADVATEETIKRVEGEGQVVFRYVDVNPNGSMNDIAGVSNGDGKLGMATGRPVGLLSQWLLDRVAA